ncbi:MAG: methyltransferase domain-containing protein [Pseudomonadota bacterium]
MRLTHLKAFAPICLQCRSESHTVPLRLAPGAQRAKGENDVIIDGALVCHDCNARYPIIDRIPFLLTDPAQGLRDNLAAITRRDDLSPANTAALNEAAVKADPARQAERLYESCYGWDSYGRTRGGRHNEPFAPFAPGCAAGCIARAETLRGRPLRGAILELGCAAGGACFALARHQRDHPRDLVLGIDLRFHLLRIAHQALANTHVTFPLRREGHHYEPYRAAAPRGAYTRRVDFWLADALALPFAQKTARHVVALNLLECVPDPAGLLASMRTVASESGIIASPYDWSEHVNPPEAWLVSIQSPSTPGTTPETIPGTIPSKTLTAQLRAAGWTVIAEDRDVPWQTRLYDRGTMAYRTHVIVAH